MKLGKPGAEWVGTINACYIDGRSMCTTWQQTFFDSFWQKADDFEEEANISQKQLDQLNKIAEIFGIDPKKVEDFI